MTIIIIITGRENKSSSVVRGGRKRREKAHSKGDLPVPKIEGSPVFASANNLLRSPVNFASLRGSFNSDYRLFSPSLTRDFANRSTVPKPTDACSPVRAAAAANSSDFHKYAAAGTRRGAARFFFKEPSKRLSLFIFERRASFYFSL